MTNSSCVVWSSYFKIANQWNWGRSYNWSPTQPIAAICTGDTGMETPVPQGSNAVLLVKFDQSVQEFTQNRCIYFTNMSWNSAGNRVAYINLDRQLSVIDIDKSEFLQLGIQQKDIKFDKGPWYSKSGITIAAIDGNKIYVAQMDGSPLNFKVVANGTDFTWK
jgi:hypothetical protein